MIDAASESIQPGSCLGWHAREDFWDRARDVEGSHQSVEAQPEPSDHLAHASLRRAPHQFHLAQSQMRMDNTESGGEIVIGFRFDEWDLMIVPENRHRP